MSIPTYTAIWEIRVHREQETGYIGSSTTTARSAIIALDKLDFKISYEKNPKTCCIFSKLPKYVFIL